MPDRGLLDEVAGLVEWPVPLLGRIDDAFMDLPPEVMRTTMRVNQRYFALRTPDGALGAALRLRRQHRRRAMAAPRIVAGNERVLRARLADARFFWDQDRRQTLEEFLPKLDGVVFHARLGTQGERVRRLDRLARADRPQVGADIGLAARAAQLAKADLASGMVGEFPELQGIMGRYYALADGEDPRVAEAIGEPLPAARPGGCGAGRARRASPWRWPTSWTQLVGFFAVGEKPTGSGDPFALRRAALGVIRMIAGTGCGCGLAGLIGQAFFGFPRRPAAPPARNSAWRSPPRS